MWSKFSLSTQLSLSKNPSLEYIKKFHFISGLMAELMRCFNSSCFHFSVPMAAPPGKSYTLSCTKLAWSYPISYFYNLKSVSGAFSPHIGRSLDI
jgi:hypothetical protein